MSKEKQIEEMALIMCGREGCKTCTHFIDATKCAAVVSAKNFYNAGYRKQGEGEWKRVGGDLGYIEAECSVCGYADVSDDDNEPHKFCPECGAKMKGGAE